MSSKDSLEHYNGQELYKQVYKEPVAQIHYPVKSRKVTAQGFVRDEPSLFDRIMVRYDKWHKDRNKMQGVSPRSNQQLSYDHSSQLNKTSQYLDDISPNIRTGSK